MGELYYAKSALVGFIVSNIAFMIYVANADPGHGSDQILTYGLMVAVFVLLSMAAALVVSWQVNRRDKR